MEVTLVHPDSKEDKVVLTNPIQIAAYKGQGFVEPSELETPAVEPGVTASTDNSEEVAQLKAENKALKSENTKLKNKLAKASEDNSNPDQPAETEVEASEDTATSESEGDK